MFVAENNGKTYSRFVGCFGVMLAIVVGIGCSSDEPVAAGATLEGGSKGQGGSTSTAGSTDGDGSSAPDAAASAPDAAAWSDQCRAVTPPAPNCPCLCRECAEVTALCFGSSDCPPIIDCAQRTGCRSSVECLDACGPEIAAHMAGIIPAQNFRSCLTMNCAAACVLPDASTDSSDGTDGF